MENAITVYVMGRDITLRVKKEDEELTREIAAYVDAKMKAFKTSFPKQPEMTTAVVTALALAEELYTAREALTGAISEAEQELDGLADRLGSVLPGTDNGTSHRTRKA